MSGQLDLKYLDKQIVTLNINLSGNHPNINKQPFKRGQLSGEVGKMLKSGIGSDLGSKKMTKKMVDFKAPVHKVFYSEIQQLQDEVDKRIASSKAKIKALEEPGAVTYENPKLYEVEDNDETKTQDVLDTFVKNNNHYAVLMLFSALGDNVKQTNNASSSASGGKKDKNTNDQNDENQVKTTATLSITLLLQKMLKNTKNIFNIYNVTEPIDDYQKLFNSFKSKDNLVSDKIKKVEKENLFTNIKTKKTFIKLLNYIVKMSSSQKADSLSYGSSNHQSRPQKSPNGIVSIKSLNIIKQLLNQYLQSQIESSDYRFINEDKLDKCLSIIKEENIIIPKFFQLTDSILQQSAKNPKDDNELLNILLDPNLMIEIIKNNTKVFRQVTDNLKTFDGEKKDKETTDKKTTDKETTDKEKTEKTDSKSVTDDETKLKNAIEPSLESHYESLKTQDKFVFDCLQVEFLGSLDKKLVLNKIKKETIKKHETITENHEILKKMLISSLVANVKFVIDKIFNKKLQSKEGRLIKIGEGADIKVNNYTDKTNYTELTNKISKKNFIEGVDENAEIGTGKCYILNIDEIVKVNIVVSDKGCSNTEESNIGCSGNYNKMVEYGKYLLNPENFGESPDKILDILDDKANSKPQFTCKIKKKQKGGQTRKAKKHSGNKILKYKRKNY
jgi:hypothetical protein